VAQETIFTEMGKMAQLWHQLASIATTIFVLNIISHLFTLAESKADCKEKMEDMVIKNPYSRKIKYGMIKCHLNKEELHFLHLGDTGGDLKNSQGFGLIGHGCSSSVSGP
jgi:hypothetical protein